jgi:hypothetical protein
LENAVFGKFEFLENVRLDGVNLPELVFLLVRNLPELTDFPEFRIEFCHKLNCQWVQED